MIRFIKLVLWLLISSHNNLYSQIKFDYQWIVGSDVSDAILGTEATLIDFQYSPPKTFYQTNSSAQDLAVIGEICDKNTGRLMMYSNSCVIFDSTHQIMENGDSINYGDYWEDYCKVTGYYPIPISNIILPDNYKLDEYYMIHQKLFRPPDKRCILHNSKIHFTKEKPNGYLKYKNAKVSDDKLAPGFLTAIAHANKKDWWIVHLIRESNQYIKYLIDSSGIHVHDYQIIGDSIGGSHAQCQFSPDGKMFGWYNQEKGLQLFDFDRATGQLSNHISLMIEYRKFPGGLCFSPDSKLLYLMHRDKVFQVDLSIQDLTKSYEIIGEYIYNSGNDTLSKQTFLSAMLGPDCKVYITATNDTYYFSTIEKPDEKGKYCNFKNLGLKLIYSKFIGSIPNFPHFRVDEPYPCDKTISSSFYPTIYELALYPNPAVDRVKVQVPAKGMLSIYDVNGRSLYQKMYYHEIIEEVDVSNFSIGLYTVLFEEEYKVYKGEFVKQ